MTTPPPPKSGSALKTVLIVVGIVVLSAGICCCGGAGYMYYKGKQAINKAKSGEQFSLFGMDVNAKLPADIPAYPGAKQQISMGKTENGQGATAYVFQTADSQKKVMDFYHDRLLAAGWKEKTTAGEPEGVAAEYTKGKENLHVHAQSVGGQTQFTLTHVTGEQSMDTETTEPATTEAAPAQ